MNHGKSRYVFLGSEEFKEKTRREAKEAPVMMGSHIMEESSEEKYLGAQIRTDGLAATTTILGWLVGWFIVKQHKLYNFFYSAYYITL